MLRSKNIQGFKCWKVPIAPRGAGTATALTLPDRTLLYVVTLHVDTLFGSLGAPTLEIGGVANDGVTADTDRYITAIALAALLAGATFGMNGIALTTEMAVFHDVEAVTYTVAAADFNAGAATLTVLGYKFA